MVVRPPRYPNINVRGIRGTDATDAKETNCISVIHMNNLAFLHAVSEDNTKAMLVLLIRQANINASSVKVLTPPHAAQYITSADATQVLLVRPIYVKGMWDVMNGNLCTNKTKNVSA